MNMPRLRFEALLGWATFVSLLITLATVAFQVSGYLEKWLYIPLWCLFALTLVGFVLASARLSAVKNELAIVREENATLLQQEVYPANDIAPGPTLSSRDTRLANLINEVATDDELLLTFAEFHPYEMPIRSIRKLEDLVRLPNSYYPNHEGLQHQLDKMSKAAQEWLSRMGPLISISGKNYSTRLDEWVSQEAYNHHASKVRELENLAPQIHQVLLGYQRFYADLESEFPEISVPPFGPASDGVQDIVGATNDDSHA